MQLKILFFYGLFFFTSFCVFKPLDTKKYAQSKYYQLTQDSLASQFRNIVSKHKSSIKSGWSQVCLTNKDYTYLAGYAGRKKKKYQIVWDSLYIKVIVVVHNDRKLAIISSDLLIFPMEVRAALFNQFQLPKGFDSENIFFTATHTHHGIGGWGRRLMGRAIAGKYSKKQVSFIANSIINAIQEANDKVQLSKVVYSSIATENLVQNRLVASDKNLDTILRSVFFKSIDDKKEAALSVYSAHPTCIPASKLVLSGDYPTSFMRKIETQSKIVTMAAFAAGGVASHRPILSNEQNIQKRMDDYAQYLFYYYNKAKEDDELEEIDCIVSYSTPLYLRKPQLRINQKWILSPWLFHLFFGKYPSFINVAGLGNILMIGMPCDFSGQLSNNLINYALEKKIRLIITSFNGGYIGYITPDQFYHLKSYETRAMNLFGPENGAYISEITKSIIDNYYINYVAHP